MLRMIGGIVAGMAAWIALVTLFNILLRSGWPDYAAAEPHMTFTRAMMIARLTESAAASLASGAIAERIGGRLAASIAGGLMLLLFLPVHYRLWPVFPIWYHLTFLCSLPLLSAAGARLAPARR